MGELLRKLFKGKEKPCCGGDHCGCEPKKIPEEDQIPPDTVPEQDKIEPDKDSIPEKPEDVRG